LRGLFVTGTDTEVGKSVLAAAVCAALASRGERVAAFKPVVTGIDEPPDPAWPRDHELLAQVANAGQAPRDVAPYLFGPPVSPHYAAELAGTAIEHLDRGLFEAHARDEAGWDEEAGHQHMWFAVRDVAFEHPVTEDQTRMMLERMGIAGGGPAPDPARVREHLAPRGRVAIDVFQPDPEVVVGKDGGVVDDAALGEERRPQGPDRAGQREVHGKQHWKKSRPEPLHLRRPEPNEDQSLRKEHHHAGSRDGRQASDGDHSGRQPPDAAPCLLTKIDRERDQHC